MARLTQKSFTGGELSPSLYARSDLAKYSNGLKTLKNGFVRAEGCISNRPGLEFVCEVKNSDQKTRIVPFAFNTEQTYIIELGNNYARYIKDGGQIVYPDGHENEGEIVETETPYSTDDIFILKFGQNADVLTLCHKNYPPKELSRESHYDWILNDIVLCSQINAPTNVKAVWSGSVSSNTTTYSYVVTAVKKDSYEESERSETAEAVGHLESSWTTSDWMTISWDEVEDAIEYNVYRAVNGIYGFIGTSANTSFKDNNIEPDLTSTAPIKQNPFENDNNPSCVNYFQQRKLFGCLKNDPQTLVASQTGAENNFNISRPLVASDAINLKLSEREVNEIRHLIGLNDLIVLTSGAEWKLSTSNGLSASNPPNCAPQSYYGCSHVQPCVSGNMVLFVQAGGSVVRDLGYEYVSDSYNGDELTIFANHLFENKQIVDMAYSKEPYRILWCVMSDGTVNALTYNKKQEVSGWHTHSTDGEFESVAVIRENFEDIPYFVVKRTINGKTKRYIERMRSRLINNVQEGFFVDSGLKGSFKNKTTHIKGLNHLEGKKVVVLADGGVVEGLTVKNGSIDLIDGAYDITVGLPYTFEVETLNIEGENTHGLKKIINEINIKIDKSREDFYVVGQNGVAVQNARSKESIENSNLLITGDVVAYPFAEFAENATVCIKQDKPLPLTITSISVAVTLEQEDIDVSGN